MNTGVPGKPRICIGCHIVEKSQTGGGTGVFWKQKERQNLGIMGFEDF